VVRVLLIEDNPGDAELVKETLAEAGDAVFQVHCAGTLLHGLDRLAAGNIDLVLLDLSLPDSSGLDGLTAIRTHAPNLPVVLLTGLDNQSVALRAMQSGAQEYVVKGTLLGPALVRTLQHAMVRQQSQAESPLSTSRREPARILGLLGAKGGVGSTRIACHLAAELKRQSGERVLVMDLDLAGGAIAFLTQTVVPYGIRDASDNIVRLDECRWRKLVSQVSGGLDVIPSKGPVLREEDQPKAEHIRFVLRFVSSLYDWIVVDFGRLNPFSASVAKEVSRLYLVSTLDLLGLNEAKANVKALFELGFDKDRLALVLNRAPARPGFSQRELEKLLGVSVAAILPDCGQDFEESMENGKRLGESRKFQKHLAQFAAGIAGAGKPADTPAPKRKFPFLSGVLRSATTSAE
jgi:Flp pilus assembly CpaE family ATPase